MTFDVQRLGPAHLGLLVDLQERIRAALPDPSVFQTSTPEFIAYCLADGGRCYRVVHNGESVAYRMVYFPRDRAFNLAKDTTLPPERYHEVGHWDTVAVLPALRGNGLARLMNRRALADLADTRIRHLFATSSPANPHGVRTLMEAGFQPIDLVEKFGGSLRFLLYRPYPEPWPEPSAATPRGTRPSEPRAVEEHGPPEEGRSERLVPFSASADLSCAFRNGWSGSGLRFDASHKAVLRMVRRPLPFRPRPR